MRSLFLSTLIVLYACKVNKDMSNDVSGFYVDVIAYQENYKNGFKSNDASPLQTEDVMYIDFFEPDVNWVLKCKCKLTPSSPHFEMATYSGLTRTYKKYADIKCKYNKRNITLELYQSIDLIKNPLYKNYLFLPFKDLTNGEETYGGGRYINLSSTEIKGEKITIDFNKAYNPYCAFSTGYNCPIPPKANHISQKVNAGEKQYNGPIRDRKG